MKTILTSFQCSLKKFPSKSEPAMMAYCKVEVECHKKGKIAVAHDDSTNRNKKDMAY